MPSIWNTEAAVSPAAFAFAIDVKVLNFISVALLLCALLAGIPIFETVRTDVNEKLAPEYRFRFFRGRMGDE